MPRIKTHRWGQWAAWAGQRIAEDRPEVIAVDTETSGLGFYDEAFCATLTWRSREGKLTSAYIALEIEEAYTPRNEIWLARILRQVPTWVFHNAKFDLAKLLLAGVIHRDNIDKHGIEDTQAIQALLNENERKGLKMMARRVLGEETNEEAVLKVVRRKLGLKKADGFQHIPREHIIPYALKDTEFTLRLYETLKPQLPVDVLPAYQREMGLVKALLDMEANGIGLDLDYLERTTSEYGTRVMEGWQRIVDLTENEELNPQSPIQLKAAFAERGLDLESTAEKVLKTLDDELAQAILQYRSDKKVHTTYLKALMAEQRDSIVHPWFNAVAARTGRMSSSSASH